MMSIGTRRICHVEIIVRDMEQAVENWSVILGLPKPDIWNLPPNTEIPVYTKGVYSSHSDTRLAVFELENTLIELVQPGDTPSPFKEHLDKYGPGVMHLSFVVPDRKKANAALRRIGAPEAYHIGYWPQGTYAFYDTTHELGLEINIKTDEDNTEKIPLLLADPLLYKRDLL